MDEDDPPAGVARPTPPLGWRDRIGWLADATGVSPARLVAGALGVAGLAVGALWLLRPPPEPVEVRLPFASTTMPTSMATTTSEPTELLVHVAGQVQAPGVHAVPNGARVVDAIDAAGGLAPAADTARINLAAPLTDGERVYVPQVGEEPPPVAVGTDPAGSGAPGSAPGGLVNLNTADGPALEALPGVGPATAEAILRHRDTIGAFTSVEQLLDVQGIGDAKLEQIRPLVTV